MRYYQQLSAARVEMLYGQLRSEALMSGELGVDLSLVKLKMGLQRETRKPNVYQMLEVVENWIYANEPVGSPDEPDAWILGRSPLDVTGSLGGDDEEDLLLSFRCDAGAQPLVLLSAQTDLIGSLASLREGAQDSHIAMMNSNIGLMGYRMAGLIRPLPVSNESAESQAGRISATGQLPQRFRIQLPNCEFLAKRLGYCPDPVVPPEHTGLAAQVTLATPLFIALFD